MWGTATYKWPLLPIQLQGSPCSLQLNCFHNWTLVLGGIPVHTKKCFLFILYGFFLYHVDPVCMRRFLIYFSYLPEICSGTANCPSLGGHYPRKVKQNNICGKHTCCCVLLLYRSCRLNICTRSSPNPRNLPEHRNMLTDPHCIRTENLFDISPVEVMQKSLCWSLPLSICFSVFFVLVFPSVL